jgi:hypothetical protein
MAIRVGVVSAAASLMYEGPTETTNFINILHTMRREAFVLVAVTQEEYFKMCI